MSKSVFIRRTSIMAMAFVAAAGFVTGSAQAQTTDVSLLTVAGACADQSATPLNNIHLPSLPTDLSISSAKLKGFEPQLSTLNSDKLLEAPNADCLRVPVASDLTLSTPQLDSLTSQTLTAAPTAEGTATAPPTLGGDKIGERVNLLPPDVWGATTVDVPVVSPDVTTPAIARLSQEKQPATQIESTSGDDAKTKIPQSPAADTKVSEPSKPVLVEKRPSQKVPFNTVLSRDTSLKQRKSSQTSSTTARSDIVLGYRDNAAVILLFGAALFGFSIRKPINRAFRRALKMLETTKQFISREAHKPDAQGQNPNTNQIPVSKPPTASSDYAKMGDVGDTQGLRVPTHQPPTSHEIPQPSQLPPNLRIPAPASRPNDVGSIMDVAINKGLVPPIDNMSDATANRPATDNDGGWRILRGISEKKL